jgi:GntR family transcriptional repressor for pyruvate dehydrogenase complex
MSRSTRKPDVAARRSTAPAKRAKPRVAKRAEAAPERPEPVQPEAPALQSAYRPTVFIAGRTEKKAETLARQILDDVLASGLAPGSVLPGEAAMLAQYRVGRTTLREAQRILEVHGLLDIRSGSGGGPVVAVASSRDFARMSSLFYRAAGVRLRHLLDARQIIEPMAARLAAAHQDPAGIERLRELVADLEEKPDVNDNRRFLGASRDFHDVVNALSGNPIIDLFTSGLVDMFTDRMAGFIYPVDQRQEAARQHLAIGRAILRGNGAAAERLMREHMTDYGQYAMEGWSGGLNEVISWR